MKLWKRCLAFGLALCMLWTGMPVTAWARGQWEWEGKDYSFEYVVSKYNEGPREWFRYTDHSSPVVNTIWAENQARVYVKLDSLETPVQAIISIDRSIKNQGVGSRLERLVRNSDPDSLKITRFQYDYQVFSGYGFAINFLGAANHIAGLEAISTKIDEVPAGDRFIAVWSVSGLDVHDLDAVKEKFAEVKEKVDSRGGKLCVIVPSGNGNLWPRDYDVSVYEIGSDAESEINDIWASETRGVLQDAELRIDLKSELAESIVDAQIVSLSDIYPEQPVDSDVAAPVGKFEYSWGSGVGYRELSADRRSVVFTTPELPNRDVYVDLRIRVNPEAEYVDVDALCKLSAGSLSIGGKTKDLPDASSKVIKLPESLKTIEFIDEEDGSSVSFRRYPGEYIIVPEIDRYSASGKVADGWKIDDYGWTEVAGWLNNWWFDEERAGGIVFPGMSLQVPSANMIFKKIYGNAEVDLLLGEVTPAPPAGNRISDKIVSYTDKFNFLNNVIYRNGEGPYPSQVTELYVVDEDVPYQPKPYYRGMWRDYRFTMHGGLSGWGQDYGHGIIGSVRYFSGQKNADWLGLDEVNPVVGYELGNEDVWSNNEDVMRGTTISFYLAGRGGVTVPNTVYGLTGINGNLHTADLRMLHIEDLQDMSELFTRAANAAGGHSSGCSFRYPGLTFLNIAGWDTSKVTTMDTLVEDASVLRELNMAGWDVSSLRTMRRAFANTGSNELEINMAWHGSPDPDIDTTGMLDGRTGPIKLEIGDYSDDAQWDWKRTILQAFFDWESENGYGLTVTSNGEQIYPAETMSVSELQEVDYIVELYFDGELKETKVLQGEIGTIVEYAPEEVDGYAVDRVETVTLGEDAEANVVKVYYEKAEAPYEQEVPQEQKPVYKDSGPVYRDSGPVPVSVWSRVAGQMGQTQVRTAVLAGYARDAGSVDNVDVDYDMAIPTATKATPLYTGVQYIVRIRYEGDEGVRSGKLSVRYPLPEGVVPKGDGAVQVGVMMKGDALFDTTEDRIVEEFKVTGNDSDGYELTGAITDVAAGTYVDVSVDCLLKEYVEATKKEVETGEYHSWTSTAYIQAENHSAVSNPLRLWNFDPNGDGEGDPEPPTADEAKIQYEFRGDVPDGVQVPEVEFKAPGDTVSLEEPANPEKYEFEGWYRKNDDGSLGAKVTGPYTVKDSDVAKGITFIGMWKMKDLGDVSVRYEYKDEGGYEVPAQLDGLELGTTVKLGKSLHIATMPMVEHYDATGWQEVKVNDADSDALPKAGVLDTGRDEYGLSADDTVTYIGGYIAQTGTIRFNANGGTGTVPGDRTVSLGNPEGELPGPGGLGRTGWTFKGWSTKADGTGDVYEEGDPLGLFVWSGELKKDETLDVYAVWEQNPSELLVFKGVDKVKVEPGEEVLYRIDLYNSGDATLNNVTVRDALDANLEWLGATLDGVTVTPAGSVYAIGIMAGKATKTLEIRAKVKETAPKGRIGNTATVEYDGVPETKKPESEIEITVRPPVVTITIEYVDPDDNIVGTEKVEVERNSDYDVTGDAERGVPMGWEKDPDKAGDPAKGKADGDKTIKVPVRKPLNPPKVEGESGHETVYNGKPQSLPKDKIKATVDGNPVSEGRLEVIEYRDKDGNKVPSVPKDAGDYTVTVKVKDEDGNEIGTVTVKYTIKPATLVAVYEGEVIRPGENPDGKVTVTGFVNGETSETAEGYKVPVVDFSKINLDKAKKHTLKPVNGEAKNYVFEYRPGELNIWKPNKKPSFGHVIVDTVSGWFRPRPTTGEVKNPETGR